MFHRIVLLIFGFSLVGTAIWHHTPINEVLSFDKQEDQIHSLFASLVGFSFTMLALATSFIKVSINLRFLPFGIALLATGLSLLMFVVESYMGIWQRLMFLISFGWMLYEFSRPVKQ